MEVETVFDMYKNFLQADWSYMQTDAYLAGWMFINHFATMLYYTFLNIIMAKRKLESLSPKDLLMRLSRGFHLRIVQEWIQAEIPLSSQKILKSLTLLLRTIW